ncbi:N-acetylglucosaminidase [Lentibacillus daqui]|uniref:N-acetylglucosaminidase n=1 Tax=Lentibacillus daqui TaxID=2911514 RepID=UPI0022B12675|nr:GW dipeptide domain-containing protein [Lentibacillus daqui]
MEFCPSLSAYTKAWGGSKDLVYEDMSSYKHQKFHVNLTEKVGNNTWYRGNFNGKTIWLHESYLTTKEESNTSKLGHIRSEKVNIYKTISDTSTKFAAGEEYTNQVYYIKRQAKIGEQTFYLISLTPSREDGVIGWVQADDLSLHDHVGVDKKKKTLYFTGKGSAYTKAWGGSKDLVYKDMSSYESQAFHVNLTEKVGNNTWYRGKFNGKTIWLHESYLTMKDTNRISKLGHLHGNANIYKSLGDRSSLLNTSNYTNAVYYIKQQAKVNDQTYYLISKQPSVINGTVGWVNASDMSTHDHVGVDKKSKILKVVGTGSAYSKAWGGSKDLVYSDVSKFKGQEIKVNLTEKVGNNIWYRGTLNGKTVWFHESYLKKTKEVITDYTTYNLSLDKMLDLQMKVNPQTDKQYKLWIREDAFGSISNGKGTVKGENWNLRRGPGTNYLSGGRVGNGTKLPIKGSQKVSGYTWYHIGYTTGWVTADPTDVRYYLDYRNFTDSLKDKLQFLKLSESSDASVSEINEKILKGNGILEGKAQSFTEGSQKYNINEIYLISHALLETGNGTSELANGVKYKGKKVYNMYGVGANDGCAVECGAKYAYDAGWFTPEDAITGGAAFVSENYVQAGQDTLYKMRWNPLAAANTGTATHQYATDIGWAYKQTSRMYDLYNLLDGYKMILDIPRYQ